MPDERMHQLRVHHEGTRGNERNEIHDGHSTNRRTAARRPLSARRVLALIATDPHRDESGLTVPLSTMMHSTGRMRVSGPTQMNRRAIGGWGHRLFLLEGPEGNGATDDGREGQRAEVAAVE